MSDFCRVDKDYIVVLRLLACVLEIGRTLRCWLEWTFNINLCGTF